MKRGVGWWLWPLLGEESPPQSIFFNGSLIVSGAFLRTRIVVLHPFSHRLGDTRLSVPGGFSGPHRVDVMQLISHPHFGGQLMI